MVQAQVPLVDGLTDIAAQFSAAGRAEPHPLRPQPREVVAYVARLQTLDRRIRAITSQAGDDLPYAEREELARKRRVVNAQIRRQALLAGRRAGRDRAGALAALNGLFKLGTALETPLQGRYRGDLITPCLWPPLDSFGRALARVWLPWLGKRFDGSAQAGDNIFTPEAMLLGHIFWPLYFGYKPYKDGLVTAFRFRTYPGEGVEDPPVPTLKLDYSDRTNPGFLVRSVLDEVTQLSSDYYLGKAFLRAKSGELRLAAFFALRKWVD